MLKPLTIIAAGACLATGASAQTSAAPRAGGLAGLLGGAVPGIGSVGVGNAAGLVGYCLKNNLLAAAPAGSGVSGATAGQASPTGAQAILERLTGRQGVQSSPAYAAGQAGQVQTPNGRTLSLDDARGQVKTQLCKLALKRAKSFL